MKSIYTLGFGFLLLFIATFSGYVHGYESGREDGISLKVEENLTRDSIMMEIQEREAAAAASESSH